MSAKHFQGRSKKTIDLESVRLHSRLSNLKQWCRVGKCLKIGTICITIFMTSPPYFNVKDYGRENIGSINEFSEYLQEMQRVFNECYRVLEPGRYICVNISDIISDHAKYPIPAHYVLMLQRAGFEYREDIIWKKPAGVGANGGECQGTVRLTNGGVFQAQNEVLAAKNCKSIRTGGLSSVKTSPIFRLLFS